MTDPQTPPNPALDPDDSSPTAGTGLWEADLPDEPPLPPGPWHWARVDPGHWPDSDTALRFPEGQRGEVLLAADGKPVVWSATGLESSDVASTAVKRLLARAWVLADVPEDQTPADDTAAAARQRAETAELTRQRDEARYWARAFYDEEPETSKAGITGVPTWLTQPPEADQTWWTSQQPPAGASPQGSEAALALFWARVAAEHKALGGQDPQLAGDRVEASVAVGLLTHVRNLHRHIANQQQAPPGPPVTDDEAALLDHLDEQQPPLTDDEHTRGHIAWLRDQLRIARQICWGYEHRYWNFDRIGVDGDNLPDWLTAEQTPWDPVLDTDLLRFTADGHGQVAGAQTAGLDVGDYLYVTDWAHRDPDRFHAVVQAVTSGGVTVELLKDVHGHIANWPPTYHPDAEPGAADRDDRS